MRSSVLYITYDGILEPLGQSQVLRYLERLCLDRRIVLISYEKEQDWREEPRRKALQEEVARRGIVWIPLRYHKRPSAIATAFDIEQGIAVATWAVVRYSIAIVHARSYVPSVIALTMKRLFDVKYIFDMRGLWPDERVDGGLWSAESGVYRAAKWFERRFLLNADRVVSLTHAAVQEIRKFDYLQGRMPQFEVITTCADLDLFRTDRVAPLPITPERPFTLGYVGSVGVWYLFDETLRCFKLLRERIPDARLRILNRGAHDYIRERMIAIGVDPSAVSIETADHAGVARAMREMDAGIFFYKPTYSRKGTAPTRLGEFLGCGVPCLGNEGVGDTASILTDNQVGVAVSGFDESSMRTAIDRMVELARAPDITARCRQTAVKYFSLTQGAERYRDVYAQLTLESDQPNQ